MLAFSWVNKEGYVHGDYCLFATKDILKYQGLESLLAEKLLPIGCAANGDTIVIRFTNDCAEVGMLSHEEMGHGTPWLEVYVPALPSLDEFLLRIVDRLYLPIDRYAAREFATLRAEMDTKAAIRRLKSE